jgi:transposase-like protein
MCMMKLLKESPVKTRRQYDATFKREAVENWMASGKSAAVIAEELGIKPERLFAWKKLLAPTAIGRRSTARSRAEPADLQS